MAVTAMRQLGMNTAGTEIVLGGGLLQAGDPLLSRELEVSFAMDAPGAIIRVASVPPIAGAALLGLDHLGVSVAAKERLRQSFATGASGTRGAGELSVSPFARIVFAWRRDFIVCDEISTACKKSSGWRVTPEGVYDRSPRLVSPRDAQRTGFTARAAPVTPPNVVSRDDRGHSVIQRRLGLAKPGWRAGGRTCQTMAPDTQCLPVPCNAVEPTQNRRRRTSSKICIWACIDCLERCRRPCPEEYQDQATPATGTEQLRRP
jgi:hypothetical protein